MNNHETVEEATEAALRNLRPLRRKAGLVAVIRKLARIIDDLDVDGTNSAGKIDNVTVPTYLKYAEALGMYEPAAKQTPAASKAVPAVPKVDDSPGGKIVALQARAAGRMSG